MSLSILNNISSLSAQNQLQLTQASLSKTLQQLSSGSRINSGADDAAGLAIADGLNANVTALTQSTRNATDGVGMLQVADGALSQITSLLNRAVTLATESSTGTVSDSQRTALDAEFTSIKTEINTIGQKTTYNGQAIFGAAANLTVYMSDSSSAGTTSVSVTIGQVDAGHLGAVSVSADALDTAAHAQTAIGDINSAIAAVASLRGTLGASSNQLQAASSVMSNQIQNLTSAEDGIRSADIGQASSDLSKFTILQQTGIDALQQSNNMEQSVLKLLQ
ncbi:MAG TPA: flagellin [Terriglobales bacterium]|jgi:flagellin